MKGRPSRRTASQKGVTPVVATIILIAGTLVLAFVVSAYSFSLIGSNVKVISATSATLYGGATSATGAAATSSLTFTLNNPGSATPIGSLTLTGASGLSVSFWCTSSGGGAACAPVALGASEIVQAGQVSSFTFYPYTNSSSLPVATGETFNYVINLANGQSVSGSLLAQ